MAIGSINAGAELYSVIKKLVEDIRKTEWYKKKTLKERDFIDKSIEYHIEEGVKASEKVLEEAKNIRAEQQREVFGETKEGIVEGETIGKVVPEEPTTEGVTLKGGESFEKAYAVVDKGNSVRITRQGKKGGGYEIKEEPSGMHWSVRHVGLDEAMGMFETKKEAMSKAKQLATEELATEFEPSKGGRLTETEKQRNIEEAKKDMKGAITDMIVPKKILGMEKLTPEQKQLQLEKLATDYLDIKEYWEKAVRAATGKTLEEFTKDNDIFDLDVDQMNQLKLDNPKEFGNIFEMKTRMMDGMDDFIHLNNLVEGVPLTAEVRAQMAVLKFTEGVKKGLFPDLGTEIQQNSFISSKQAKAMIDLTADLVNIAIKAGFRGKALVEKVMKDLKDSKLYESFKGGVKFDEAKFDRKANNLIKKYEDNVAREEDYKQLKELVDSYKEDGLTKEEVIKELAEESKEDVSAAYDGETTPPSTTGGAKPPTPPKTPTSQPSPSAPGRVDADIEAGIEMTKKQTKDAETYKTNSMTAWEKFMKVAVDKASRIKEMITKIDPIEGYRAKREHELKAGAAANTAREYMDAIEDIYGSLKLGRKKLMAQNEQQLLADYIQYKRTLEVDRLADEAGEARPKSPGNIHTEQIRNIMEGFKNNNKKLLEAYDMKSFDIAKLDALEKKYTDVMKGKLKEKYDAGLITEESYNELKDIMYSPRKFIQHLDNMEVGISGKGGKMNVANSGIKEITEGSEQSLVNNPQLLLLEVIGRTNSLIAKNEANKKLAAFAKANKDNGIVEIAKPTPEYIKDPTGTPTYIDPPNKWEAVDYMENGVRKRMNILEEYAEGWNDHTILESKTAEFLHHATGTSIVKFLATTANPEFAIGNLFRDIAHIYLTTDVYSPLAPKYALELGSDMMSVFSDVLKRSGRVIEYIKEGGGMDLLSEQSMPKPQIGKHNVVTEGTNMLLEGLSYVGQTSELLTRLSIRERHIKNETRRLEKAGVTITPEMLKEIKKEGTYKARSYLDFSQGGTWAKAADKVVPYLNAGIQGTRGTFRAAHDNPALFSAKVAQIAGVTSLITGWNLWDEDRRVAYENEISLYEKAANFIIMTGTWELDERGRKRYQYIKIPKDQGQQLISGVIEDGIASSLFGVKSEKIITDRRWIEANHLLSAIPDISSIPPAFKAMISYSQNRNMFYDQPIWKGEEFSDKSLERTLSTPYGYSGASDVLKNFGMDLSPDRAKVAVEQIIPKNSTLAGMAGLGLSAITGGMSPADKYATEKSMGERISKAFAGRKLFGLTNPDHKSSKVKEAQLVKNDIKGAHDIELDQMIAPMGRDASKWKEEDRNKIIEWTDTFQEKEKNRLRDRWAFYGSGADYFTISLKNADTDVGARAYAEEFFRASKEERMQIVERANKIDLLTEPFMIEVNKNLSRLKKESQGK